MEKVKEYARYYYYSFLSNYWYPHGPAPEPEPEPEPDLLSQEELRKKRHADFTRRMRKQVDALTSRLDRLNIQTPQEKEKKEKKKLHLRWLNKYKEIENKIEKDKEKKQESGYGSYMIKVTTKIGSLPTHSESESEEDTAENPKEKTDTTPKVSETGVTLATEGHSETTEDHESEKRPDVRVDVVPHLPVSSQTPEVKTNEVEDPVDRSKVDYESESPGEIHNSTVL